MSVTVAQTAGFCFGVRRAVDLAEQQAAKHGEIYAYGEIIHNTHEVARLEKQGVRTANTLDEIPDGARVLIRAHGVPRSVYRTLESKGCEVFDATCPFVHKIHSIVNEQSEAGRLIVIFGSRNHPEVLGIQGWCGESVVLENEEQARTFAEQQEPADKPLAVVAQTTVNRAVWNISVGLIKKRCTNLKIFDTICKATDERQSEARLLAGKSDQMIVIGDKKSSNTKRLYEISRSLCNNALYIEDVAELTTQELRRNGRVGITAGASTPAWRIKEYITEINRQRKRVVGSIRQIQQEARKAAAEQIWGTIEIGNEYEGTVKSLTSYGAFVDIGGVDGMVHISELSWGRIKHPSEVVAVGDKVKVFVIGLDKENKKISLGYKREEDNPWNVFKSKYDIGSVAEVKILKFMPFGAFAEIVPGVDGLIHISQIADHRIAKPEDVLEVGQQVEAKIIDINDEKKKVSLSIRALLLGDDEYDDE